MEGIEGSNLIENNVYHLVGGISRDGVMYTRNPGESTEVCTAEGTKNFGLIIE